MDPWVRKTPWRRKWQPTLVFLPGKSHGQRSVASYSPWGCKELDTTERLSKAGSSSLPEPLLKTSVSLCFSGLGLSAPPADLSTHAPVTCHRDRAEPCCSTCGLRPSGSRTGWEVVRHASASLSSQPRPTEPAFEQGPRVTHKHREGGDALVFVL